MKDKRLFSDVMVFLCIIKIICLKNEFQRSLFLTFRSNKFKNLYYPKALHLGCWSSPRFASENACYNLWGDLRRSLFLL